MTVISKAALAAELRVSKARVSQYIRRGLPIRSDGAVNREDALAWLNRNAISGANQDKGSALARRLLSGRTDRPAKESRNVSATAVLWEPTVLDQIENPFDQGAVWMAHTLVYRTAHMAAAMAMMAGASMPVADALSRFMTFAMMTESADRMHAFGVEPYASDIDTPNWQPSAEILTDWAAFAVQAGEPFDLQAWVDHQKAMTAKAEAVRSGG